MKKIILSGLTAALVCVSANASDGGLYLDTESTTVRTYRTETVAAPRAVVSTPCPYAAGNAISVKTHTEVIDHYQMYQPVVVYTPAGTYAQRRVVSAPRPRCNRCGY